MDISERELEHVRRVKRRHITALMQKANVVGVGIGIQKSEKRENYSHHPVLVVNVTRKVKRWKLRAKDIIPSEIEDVPVEIEAIGEPRAYDD